MTLAVSYREFLVEKLLLQYLKGGIIPTPDQIETDLAAYQLNHPDLSLPKSKYTDFSVERGSSSSAGKIETLIDTISNDVIASIKEIYKLATANAVYYERWQNELSRLEIKANRLKDRADALLLLANNTEGYFSTIEDFLHDFSYIDTDNTTAKVDISEHKVTINSSSKLGSVSQYNTNNLSPDDIAFYPLNRDVATSYYNASQDNSLLRIFKDDNSSWVGKIVSSKSGPLTAELKIRLSLDTNIEVSKISLATSSINTSSGSSISVQYSTDGYNWFIVPATAATQSFNGIVSWRFTPVSLKWVKFIIHKPAHDSDKYEYIYSISSVQFFNNKYQTEAGDTFVTTSRYVEDSDQNKIGFFKAELNTCEDIPTNTFINYYLSASKDNSTWTDWYKIVPFDRSNTSAPKIVNFSGISKNTNSDTNTALLNSSLAAQQLTTSLSTTGVQHRFYSLDVAAINTKITVPGSIEENIVANTIEVWRNIRVQDTYPDTYKVRDVPRGWKLEGQKYTCYFKILSSSGKVIDFGETNCIIDGKSVSGIVNIPSGVHKFETTSDNWYDISASIQTTLSSEEMLKSIDPLYPFNHKLLIEGIPYGIGFSGSKIYLGTDISAEAYCKKVSLFDLENNISDYNHFAVKNIGTSSNILGVFLRYEPKNTDFTNERNLVSWKTTDNETESYKYIKLKVELGSTDSNITPEFTGYRIKLGA